jgi:DNA modification methylase
MSLLTTTATEEQYKETLIAALSGELDFHNSSSKEFTHDLHAFPAKFPPQLPRKFIQLLTQEADIILDPMVGSGTTVIEAYLANRHSIGCDIDPLSLQTCKVKVTPLENKSIQKYGERILQSACQNIDNINIAKRLETFDDKTREFLDYWFDSDVQQALFALLYEIEEIEAPEIRAFFELCFSGIIITKSGGVSRALDLAHTRPHRVSDKLVRSPFKEFEKRISRNISSLISLPIRQHIPTLYNSDAQHLPIRNNSIDLIVTSPPYPSNAIDYMRAHKFSLVWFGYSINALSNLRKEYIGGESITLFEFESLPPKTKALVNKVEKFDKKKGKVLARYYSEMIRCVREMYRVLRPGKAAIVIVGSSNMRGIDTQVHTCLEEIGRTIGFEIPHIGIRRIDRDRRMLPAYKKGNNGSQIENRMYEEHVIGFYKSAES